MSVQEVLEALDILSGPRQVAWNKAIIIKMARGLIATEFERDRFVFAHLSVKEFLETRVEYSGEYAHVVAAEACLKAYLRPNPTALQYGNFQLYALTHLGRHCLKSGALRKEPKLRSLMKEFLLPQGSNDAFERWNRDCFKTNIESAPGTSVERRDCQCRPGLPLFMVCVYGFDEFVEPTIGKQDRVFYAENFRGARPLEVAALYGNYDTMVMIWNAATLKHTSSVRTKRWLGAAARNPKLDVWNFTVKHVPDIPFRTAMVLAARNSAHGNEMVSCLLNKPVDIDEDVLLRIFSGCASFEILDMILARSSSIKFTESMLEAASRNPFINPALTEMILSKHQNLRVSRTCITMALTESYNSSSSSKAGVIKALLKHPTRCEVSEEMIYSMICHSKSEDVECLNLLLQHCSVDHITEDWLVAAAENFSTGPLILEFFLNHALGHTITQQVLQGATLNRHQAQNRLMTLFSQSGCPPVLEESLYIMTEKWSSEYMVLPTVMEACKSMYITDTYLQACAARRSSFELRHVIFLPRAFPISKDAVCASNTNNSEPRYALELLLKVKSGFEFEISENILLQALSNKVDAFGIVRVLAGQWNTLPVTEETMMAAVRHRREGTSIFEFLVQYCESVEKMMTEKVLLAAIEIDNIEFVEYFKQRKPDFVVREEFLQAAALNLYSTNSAILRILLSQEARCAISRSVLERAARVRHHTALELLLEQVAVSDLPPNISDLAEQEPSGAKTDDQMPFEAVLSAASKEGDPGKYELGTEKLDHLLSRYSGPVLDSSRLVEVAAERRDGKFVIQYLLSRFPETLVTRNALLAAASNELAMTSLLSFLLKYSHATADSKLLQLAAGNKYRGTQMVELLLASCPADAEVEREVIVAAMKNPYCARSLFDLFLARQPDLTVTQDLVDAAHENRVLSKVLLQMLLEQALTLCSMTSAELVLNKMRSTADGLRDSLFMAACYGNEVILKFLISHNISISSISGELGTALNVAVYAGNMDIVEILLKQGSDPESHSKLYGTPLQSACLRGQLDIVRILAKYGVDIDRRDQMGRTQLHKALREGNFTVADVLISVGASTSKMDHQGMVAIHHACLYAESADCVDLLIDSGAPVDAEDLHQWTPLHWAAKSGAAATVTRLLEAGAAKTKIDASGKAPFHIAMLCGNVHLRPQLYLADVLDLDAEHAGEEHPGINCDSCDLVSCLFLLFTFFFLSQK